MKSLRSRGWRAGRGRSNGVDFGGGIARGWWFTILGRCWMRGLGCIFRWSITMRFFGIRGGRSMRL